LVARIVWEQNTSALINGVMQSYKNVQKCKLGHPFKATPSLFTPKGFLVEA